MDVHVGSRPILVSHLLSCCLNKYTTTQLNLASAAAQCRAQCRAGQTKALAFASTIPTCIHTWSAAANSLQWMGALSKRSATDLLSWSSPSWHESAFLVDVLLTDSRCIPPGRQHASHAASALLGLEEWLRTASASEQTYPTSHHRQLQLCWICPTS